VIKIDIDNKIIYNSILKSKSMGELRNSIRNGNGNLIGFIGEYVVQSILKDSVISKGMYETIAKKTGRSIEDVKRIIELKIKK
jgi:hypothetical protein